ncbi:MAG TPA: 30S ribosomal protein S9 [Candidatus Absconditabacterales bacterium]|nr:30S ribosomal protein S9 [Candidatus Absconditabacterales bacterium]HPK28205.1 30S ribosomal protein S9 [Candidatus Absconditabacterales bacterium]
MVANEYNYAVGRRKETSAVIKLFPKGKGDFIIRLSSGKTLPLKEYFGGNAHLYENAIMPLLILGKDYIRQFDAEIVIRGGGVAGQSDAIKLAFARSLVDRNSDFRTQLKPYGLLKRDSRIKERKKPGLKKARKAPTWSKR